MSETEAGREYAPADGSPERGGPVAHVGQVASGFGLPFEAGRLLRRERGLWGLAAVPLGFSFLTVAVVVGMLWGNAGDVYALLDSTLPVFEVSAWYQWLWLGPAKLLMWLLGGLLFVAAVGLSLIAAFLVASLAAAPFLDALSHRVERIAAGVAIESTESGIGAFAMDVRRSLGSEAKRLAFFVGVWAAAFLIGVVVPGAHFVTGPMMVAFTILFLPLEYGGYTLDRRQVPFRARRAWIAANWPRMAGFGSAAFLACFVPIVNLAMIPVLVVAGTLLVVRHPPAGGIADRFDGADES